MDQPTHTEANQTDLPSPKPNRRRRLALRLAALVAAVSVLGAAYWFTRPPELVWWRSPPLGKTRIEVSALVPRGWLLFPVVTRPPELGAGLNDFVFTPGKDLRPRLLQRLFPIRTEDAYLDIAVCTAANWKDGAGANIPLPPEPATRNFKQRLISQPARQTVVSISYARPDGPAFNRTYRQICDSLRIE